ncbi:O-antigen ligase family protein [Tsukamurella conjunctivitidis]|uniref:O-antigen ligase family protein n=1 Tax=Tsukamurella conjunctivitidis TaxID=2592068 RepID=A0A5C5RST9_9ACTN|nr:MULTISPECIES: O-antigen ligase family protein [Tsukamurella]TWS25630.1 O-antigen ligase family protein [Tsukamurella conjunctivitidis]
MRLQDPVAAGSALTSRLERFGPPGALFVGTAGFFLLSMRQAITVPATFGMSLAQTLFAAGALVWLGAWLTGNARPVSDRAVVVAVSGYVFASFLSYGAATARGVPGVALMPMDRYVVVDLCLVGVVLLLLAVLRSEHGVRIVLAGLVLGGTLSALFALVRFGTGIDVAPDFRIPGLTKANDFVIVQNATREGLDRPQGSAGHPLELSAILTVLIPLAAALCLNARARGASALPWAVCLVILVVGDLVTVSRSAVVGTIAAVVVMCWRWPIRRLAGLVVGCAVVALVGIAAQINVVSALVQTFAGSGTDSSIKSRQVGIEYVTAHVQEHLWVGQGVGAYPALRQPVLDNQYLSRLMEAGVVGFVAFCVALAVALVLAVRASAAADGPTAELGSGVSGALAALAVIALILDTSGFLQVWYLTWILVALAGVLFRLSRAAP